MCGWRGPCERFPLLAFRKRKENTTANLDNEQGHPCVVLLRQNNHFSGKVTATHPSSQHHWRRSLPSIPGLESLIFWKGNPQSGEIVIAMKGSSTAGSTVVSHWGSEPGILSPPDAKRILPQNFSLEEGMLPQGWVGFQLQAEFLSQAWWTPSKRSRKMLALCTENCFTGGVKGSCSCHSGEVGMIF